MRKFLANIAATREKRVLFENFFSLYLLQASNYLIPLIVLPYLVRVLGADRFGLIAFAQAFIQYFITFTDYGFNFTATRDISINRHDRQQLNEIFSSVLFIKMGFVCIGLLVMLSIVFAVPKFRDDWLVYVFTYGMVFGNALFPVWFFQGMENMKYITALNAVSKLIFAVLIFVFVHNPDEFIYVPLMNSLGFVVSGIIGVWFIISRFGVRFSVPSKDVLRDQMKKGWYLFISTVAINIYTTSNTFVLGLLANNTVVGYYSAGERIIRVMTRLCGPVYQALYPYISKVVAESKDRALRTLRQVFRITLAVSAACFIILFLLSEQVVTIVLGQGFQPSVSIVRILSPLVIVVPIAYIFANLTLLPFKLDRYFSGIYISGGIINIALLALFLGLLNLGGEGVAIASVATESMLTIFMYVVLLRNGIRIV